MAIRIEKSESGDNGMQPEHRHLTWLYYLSSKEFQISSPRCCKQPAGSYYR